MMERQYIIKELENAAERLQRESYNLSRISDEYFKGYGSQDDDRLLAGLVSSRAESLECFAEVLGAIAKRIVRNGN